MSSNFDKVKEFNTTFSSPTYDKYNEDIWQDEKLIKLRLDLINEEVLELKDAIKQKNITETMDALGDILVVVYGAFDAFGTNGDKVFEEIHNSNMSKLCLTEEEAIESVEWYTKNSKYDSPSYRLCNGKDNNYIVFNKNTGKILKNQSKKNKWQEPDFSLLEKYNK